MNSPEIKVSQALARKAQSLGAEGLEWLAKLPQLVTELARDWQLVVGDPFTGGSEGYVTEAKTLDGMDVVLKVAMPPMEGNAVIAEEIWALKIANGQGYARLYRYDLSRRALLLERLGPTLESLEYSPYEQMEIICQVLRRSWVTVPPRALLKTGADLARELAEFIRGLWRELNQPCSKLVLDRALVYAREREEEFALSASVLVHGDAHNQNTLQVLGTEPPEFKLIDPDGIAAERAYDLGVLMREWIAELLADPLSSGKARCHYLAQLTGVDPGGIWQWGFIQSVSTGLFLLHLGAGQQGRQMLQVAEEWAREQQVGF